LPQDRQMLFVCHKGFLRGLGLFRAPQRVEGRQQPYNLIKEKRRQVGKLHILNQAAL